MTFRRITALPRTGQALAAMLVFVFYALSAQAADLERFYGSYEGSVILDEAIDGMVSEKARKTNVKIYEEGSGFRVDWKTIISKASGKTKVVAYSIHFRKTEHEGTFSSAMKKNLFGKWIPLNPLKGDPYVWARLDQDTLSVYALIIREDGGYEMQQYDRTLMADGNLDLVFTRVRDGMPLKTIKGVLTRQ